MGMDVYAIGRHMLDVSSLAALAADLSARFTATVVYGYTDEAYFDSNGEPREATYDMVVLGQVCYPNAAETYQLTDCHYQHRQLYQRYGEEAYTLAGVDDYEKQVLDEMKRTVYYEFSNGENSAAIYTNTIHDSFNCFDSRWGFFCNTFRGDSSYFNSWEEIYDSALTWYRKEVRELLTRVGGTEAIYLNDQGSNQYLTYEFYLWEELIQELETKFKDTTLKVSTFMFQKKFLPATAILDAFYDDFADLP